MHSPNELDNAMARRRVLAGLMATVGAALCSLPRRASAGPGATARRRRLAMLQQLLEKNRQFDAEYHGGLSNHLSMALVALQRLGATDARLGDYYAGYSGRLEPRRRPTDPLDAGSWRSHLGTERRFADHLMCFEGELARLERRTV